MTLWAKDQAEILELVAAEVTRATALLAPFNSAHEGYAVLLEEVDELWAICTGLEELLRIAFGPAAMAVRFIHNLDLHERPDPQDQGLRRVDELDICPATNGCDVHLWVPVPKEQPLMRCSRCHEERL